MTLCGHNYGIGSRAVAEAMARAALSRALPAGAWHLSEARDVDVRLGGQGMCVRSCTFHCGDTLVRFLRVTY